MSFWDSQRFPALPKPRNFLPRRSMRMFLCNGDVVPRDNKEILKIGWSGGMTAVSNKKLVTYASCLKIYMLKQKLCQKQINLQSLYQGIHVDLMMRTHGAVIHWKKTAVRKVLEHLQSGCSIVSVITLHDSGRFCDQFSCWKVVIFAVILTSQKLETQIRHGSHWNGLFVESCQIIKNTSKMISNFHVLGKQQMVIPPTMDARDTDNTSNMNNNNNNMCFFSWL